MNEPRQPRTYSHHICNWLYPIYIGFAIEFIALEILFCAFAIELGAIALEFVTFAGDFIMTDCSFCMQISSVSL